MGGLYIDVSGWSSTNKLGSNCWVGYNCYAGTFGTPFNQHYGNDQTFAGSGWNDTLKLGDFKYERRMLTAAEDRTIPGIVPTSSTPLNARTLVPLTGSNQIGSRTGIGVDDEH